MTSCLPLHYAFHVGSNNMSSTQPEISLAVPVLPLCTANLCSEQQGGCLYILVPGESGFDEFPRAIYNLGTRFTGNSTAIRQLVLRDANEGRFQPHPLSVLLDTFLLVHHRIVHNTGQFHFVGAGRIRVEDDIAVSDVLQGQRLPIHLSDGTRTGRTRNCHCWV